MIEIRLSPESFHPGDTLYAIVKKLKKTKAGRLVEIRGNKADAFEIVEARVAEIHFGWNFKAKTETWTLTLATVPNEDHTLGRWVENVLCSDCFRYREAAETAFRKRFESSEN